MLDILQTLLWGWNSIHNYRSLSIRGFGPATTPCESARNKRNLAEIILILSMVADSRSPQHSGGIPSVGRRIA